MATASVTARLCAHISMDEERAAADGPWLPLVTIPLQFSQGSFRPQQTRIKPEDIIVVRRLPAAIPYEYIQKTPVKAWKEHLQRRFAHIREMRGTISALEKGLASSSDIVTQAENTTRAAFLLTEPVTQIVGRNQQWLVSDAPESVAKGAKAFEADLCGYTMQSKGQRLLCCDGAPMLKNTPEKAWVRFNGLANPDIRPLSKYEAEAHRQALLQHTQGMDRRDQIDGKLPRFLFIFQGATVAVSNTKSSLRNNIAKLIVE